MISGIQYPAKIATGRNGEIVVASYMSHKVHVYNYDYELQRTIGCQGYMDGQFMCPSGITIDKRNQIYVSSMNKVDVFTMEGQFLNSFGSQGNGPLEFSNATDIAVGKKGEIYVADAQNNRVQVLNRDLSFRTSMSEGSSGHGSGCLSQPQAIAVNSEGNVYIADMMNHCVQAFTPDGTFLLSFGEYGAGNVPGALCSPMGIAVDGQDNVYVGNSTGSVCIFDKKGNFLRQFGSYGSKLGQFNVIRGMHIDKEGRLYVSEWNSNRIQIFEGSPFMKKQQEAEVEENLSSETEADVLQNTPKPAYMIGPTSNTPVRILSELKEPQGIVEGKNGELVVASTDQSKLFVYSRTDDYKLLTTIGGEGDQDGMFRRPCGVAITPDSLILVSSFNKLQWFTVEGKLVYAVGDGGKEEMEFDYPADVAVSHKDGRIYVLDKKNKRVQILTGDATYHSSFEFPQKDDTFTSLAINSEGNLYFADPSNNCVHVFSPSGEFLFKFGKTGSVMERGTLHSPNTVAIDNDDYVYVGSSIMLSIFDKTGKFIKAFGGNGSEPGEFSYITCLHISNSGHLYVSDYNNDRVQIFEINQTPCESETYDEGMKTLSMCRRPVYTIGPASDMPGKILSGGDIGEPAGVTVTENGDLLVLNKKKKQVFFFDSETYVPKDDEITQLLWESSRDCEILDPNDIAVCEDGCLLMCVRNQLVKLTMSEEVIASVGKRGRRGREDDELDTPDGIAVSRDGLIYVADKGNHRVQIFNSDLSYRGTCVNPNSSGCAEMDPERVAVNSEGAVYVTDRRHNCIYVFDASGKFLFEFGQRGHSRDRGRISSPVAIAIDQQDYVYISGSYIGVSIFDRQGVFIRSFGESGEDPGKFKDIKSMHIDSRGNLYVCESGNNRIQVFAGIQSQSQSEKDQTASQETTFCDVLPKVVAAEHTIAPLGITEGRNGEIIVISATDHKVYVFNQQRELTAEFGGRGDLDGYFNFPTSVAVTTDNLIVVSSHDKLQWFTITGQLVYATGNRGNEEMEFEHPDSIAIGKDGRIYVLEKKNKRVQIFNGNATYHSSFKLKVDHPPDAIAVNSDGEIYLVDTRNSCIKIVSQKGEYISKIISAGPMSLARPTAIAIDEKDQLFVGTVSGTIAVFDKQRKFQRALRGDNDPVHISTHFNLIRDLHVSRTRHIYVSEFSHNQVQIIGPLEDNAPEIESSPPAPPSTPTLPYRPIYTYGPRSVFPVKVLDGIKEPSVIISGPNNVILIATCGDHKIYSYNPTTQFLCPQIAELVNREGSDKQLLYPSGLALSADGYLLVSSENQLLKLALDGTVVAFVGNQTKMESYQYSARRENFFDLSGVLVKCRDCLEAFKLCILTHKEVSILVNGRMTVSKCFKDRNRC